MGKITEVLAKRGEITTYLALSALVQKNVESLEQQHVFDTALQYLISRKQVLKLKDKDDFTVYKLAA
jgi:hypothetical protein